MKNNDLEEDKFVAGKCPECGDRVARKKDQPAEFCVDCKIKFGIPIKNGCATGAECNLRHTQSKECPR